VEGIDSKHKMGGGGSLRKFERGKKRRARTYPLSDGKMGVISVEVGAGERGVGGGGVMYQGELVKVTEKAVIKT